MKPKVIHMRGGSPHYLCGDSLESSWKEKYLEDSFARTLPVCENCIQSYGLKYGEEAKERLLLYWETGIQSIEPVNAVNIAEQKDTETNGMLRTLREYLEGVSA
tara:strand:- start:3709 stop:4020 length:312 start_codon:yes stop_codon:yes gene_type:complete